MATDVEICNRALVKLGDKTILSLTDESTRAQVCGIYYTNVRDVVLQAYPWNFAIERATLALSTSSPVWGYANKFQLPSDPYCLRVLETKEEASGWSWRVEGRYLLTDAGTASIRYIKRVIDSAQFSEQFVEVLSSRLAATMAITLTGDEGLAEKWGKIYDEQLKEARSLDGQEGTPAQTESRALLDVR